MTEQKHRIWSDFDLDYEDWRADLEAEYPELTEDERMMLMYDINNGYLDDERANLNIQLDQRNLNPLSGLRRRRPARFLPTAGTIWRF